MGAMQNNKKQARVGQKKRGTVRNEDRLAAFSSVSASGGADWGACDPKWLQTVLVGITELGGAITFGMSRDLGAHSLTLLLDGNRQTLWFNGDSDLNEELQIVAAKLEAMQ
jgi:hypothetical protein